MAEPRPASTLPKHWAFALAVFVQLVILAAIPAQKVGARLHGERITLETVPVDPYNILSGYYMTLAYAVERPPEQETALAIASGEAAWVTVERNDPVWTFVSVTREKPGAVEGRVSIRATWNGSLAHLEGVDRLYVPEAQRSDLERLMREANGKALVEMSVDSEGHAAVWRLRVGGRAFGE